LGRYVRKIWSSFLKGDMILLILCLMATAFGCLMVSSTTAYMGTARLLTVQLVAAGLGLLVYAVMSTVDFEFFSEHRSILVFINLGLLILLIPFGTDNGSGNRSWLNFPFLPVDIQPAEICKILFILICASVMASHQNRRSAPTSVLHLAFHMILLVGLNIVLSKDVGVSLIFVFIFIGMALAGGISVIWFLLAGGAIGALAPIIYYRFLDEYQRLRIQVLFDPSLDPYGQGPRYHTMQALKSLTGGAMTGQGLGEGYRTQQGALVAQHTDFIYSAIGEELGFVGCVLVLILLVLIIARIIWIGNRSSDYGRRLICYGVASALIFQVMSNVGMCIGITPIIGLTLPFISYGGSSLVTLYAMIGLVAGVYARPAAPSHERYIRPPLKAHLS